MGDIPILGQYRPGILGQVEQAPEHRGYEEVEVRWITLRGGPSDGGHLAIPVKSHGDITIHNTPYDIETWQDSQGSLHAGFVLKGGEYTSGSSIYHVDEGADFAQYVEHENPDNESQDHDLAIYRPYLGEGRGE